MTLTKRYNLWIKDQNRDLLNKFMALRPLCARNRTHARIWNLENHWNLAIIGYLLLEKYAVHLYYILLGWSCDLPVSVSMSIETPLKSSLSRAIIINSENRKIKFTLWVLNLLYHSEMLKFKSDFYPRIHISIWWL